MEENPINSAYRDFIAWAACYPIIHADRTNGVRDAMPVRRVTDEQGRVIWPEKR